MGNSGPLKQTDGQTADRDARAHRPTKRTSVPSLEFPSKSNREDIDKLVIRLEEMRNPEKICSQLLLIPSGTKLLILHKGPSINEVCKPFLILDPLDLLHFTVKLTLSESTSKGLG